MKQTILGGALLLLSCLSATGQYGRNGSELTVKQGDDVFLPYHKGEVVMPSDGAPVAARRLADYMMLCDSINPPLGFKLAFYCEGNAMNIRLDPYILADGEILAGAGAQVDIWFNDLTNLFRQQVVGDICFMPVKRSDFMGYPVYDNGTHEVTVIYKGREPLFIPVTREEYLNALIREEEKRIRENDTGASDDEVLEEMKKVYKTLLETDKEAAAEFKAEMESYAADLKKESPAGDLLTALKRELEELTPEQRKSQAFYESGIMGENGFFSGLADCNSPYASPLVRPDNSITDYAGGAIKLMVIQWTPGSADREAASPGLYRCPNRRGYNLTDCRLADLYNDREVWTRIIELVK